MAISTSSGLKNYDFIWLLRNALHTHLVAFRFWYVRCLWHQDGGSTQCRLCHWRGGFISTYSAAFRSLDLLQKRSGEVCDPGSPGDWIKLFSIILNHSDISVQGNVNRRNIAPLQVKGSRMICWADEKWDIFWGSCCVKQLYFRFILRSVVLWMQHVTRLLAGPRWKWLLATNNYPLVSQHGK